MSPTLSLFLKHFNLVLNYHKFVDVEFHHVTDYEYDDVDRIIIWLNGVPVLSRYIHECDNDFVDLLKHPNIGTYYNYNGFINLLQNLLERDGYKVRVSWCELERE